VLFAAPNVMRDCTPALLFAALVLSSVTLASGPARAIMLRGAFDGTQPIMPMRLDRNGVVSTCEMPKTFPGSTETATPYEVFEFCNNGPAQCITVDFNVGTCDSDVHLIGYVGAFDPQNLAANYAGDLGMSESGTFSFTVPSKQHLFIVAQSNFPGTNCEFSFVTNALPCIQPAPVLSYRADWLLVAALALIGFAAARRSRRSIRA
jgi:hypothetical protein